MASLNPPQAPLSWMYTPQDVLRIIKEVIETNKQTIDSIASLVAEECNFKSVRDVAHICMFH